SPHHIDVEDHVLPLGPEAFHLGFQGAVEVVPIDLLPFQKIFRYDVPLEFGYGHEIIVLPLFLPAPAGPGSGGDRKGQVEFRLFEQVFDNGGLPTARGCREYDEFTTLGHSTLSICSLIFSSSSFIC